MSYKLLSFLDSLSLIDKCDINMSDGYTFI